MGIGEVEHFWGAVSQALGFVGMPERNKRSPMLKRPLTDSRKSWLPPLGGKNPFSPFR
jgi:hypothetical protein